MVARLPVALGIDTDRFVGVFGAEFFAADHYLADALQRRRTSSIRGSASRPTSRPIAAARAGPHRRPVRPHRRRAGLDAMRDCPAAHRADQRDRVILASATAARRRSRTGARRCGPIGTVFDLPPRRRPTSPRPKPRSLPCAPITATSIDATTATEMKSTPDSVAINALSCARSPACWARSCCPSSASRPRPRRPRRRSTSTARSSSRPENLDSSTATCCSSRCARDARLRGRTRCGRRWRSSDGGVVEVGNHWEYGGAVAARRVVLDDIRAAPRRPRRPVVT